MKTPSNAGVFDKTRNVKPREEGVTSRWLSWLACQALVKQNISALLLKKILNIQGQCAAHWLDENHYYFERISAGEDSRFRSIVIGLLNILDRAFKGGYNFILDGTFAGAMSITRRTPAYNHVILCISLC